MASGKVHVEIKDTDFGWAKLVEELEKVKRGAYVKVGLMGHVKDLRAGEPIGAVALGVIHEFGAPKANIPERSFLRSTCDLKVDAEWNDLRIRLADLIYTGKMTVERALGLLGARASADVRARITEGDEIPPPAMPATFMRKLKKNAKGFNSTGLEPRNLVDTGRMAMSISWSVVMGGNEGENGATSKDDAEE